MGRRKDKGRHGQDMLRRNRVLQDHKTKGREGFRRYSVKYFNSLGV